MKTKLLSVIIAFAASIAAAATWYVSPTAPAVGDGTSEDAPTSLTNAIDRAAYGETVQLAGGDYQLTSLEGIFVTNGISLKGNAENPESVTIHAVSTNVTSKLLYLADSSIEGITFTGAYVNNDTTSQYATLFATNALIANCVFTDVTVNHQGKQVRIWNDTFVTNTVFRNFQHIFGDAYSGEYLGMIYATGATFVDCAVTNNTHCSRYCGVVIAGANTTFKNVTIADNTLRKNERSKQGGGLTVYGNDVLIEDCIIRNNKIYNSYWENNLTAGAVYVTGRAIFRRTVIQGNYTENGICGGVLVRYVGSKDGRSVVFENCLIADNSTGGNWLGGNSYVGGVYLIGTSDVKFYYTTISGNYCANTGRVISHGLYLADQTGLEVYNSIINGNGVDETRFSYTNFVVKANALVKNSNISSEAEVSAFAVEGSGEGCIYVDPIFADSEAGDYSINAESPCFDKGAAIEGIELDITGKARESWNAPDMGCYEYVADGGRIDVFATKTTVQSNRGNVDFSAYIFPSDNIAEYIWIVTDVDGVSTEYSAETPIFSYDFSEIGVSSVALKVVWKSGMVVVSEPCDIDVQQGRSYVSLDGGNVYPYDTPEKAARNINDAMAVVFGDQDAPADVILMPGVYNCMAGTMGSDWFVNITTPVNLQGGGARPEDTVLDGGHTNRILSITAEGVGAKVSNLSLLNAASQGKTDTRRGYAADLRAGTIQNCIISNSMLLEGSESVVYLNGGSIIDSIICKTSGTIPQWGKNCGSVVQVASGLVKGCLIYGNYIKEKGGAAIYLSGSNASAIDCVVRGNTLYYNEDYSAAEGGGAAGISARNGALVERCEVYGNTANGSNVARYALGILAFGGSRIIDCVISNNVCNGNQNFGKIFAGGLLLGKNVYLKQCVVAGNRLTSNNEAKNPAHAGGITCYESGIVIENCTIYGNKNSMPQKSGVYLNSNAITNSIAWGNGNTSGGEWISGNITNVTGHVGYTCSIPLEPGEGNTDGDPRFVAPEEGNYQLGPYSAARNSGNGEGFVRGTDKDLAGKQRIVGKEIDMGCYEWQRNPTLMRLE